MIKGHPLPLPPKKVKPHTPWLNVYKLPDVKRRIPVENRTTKNSTVHTNVWIWLRL